MNNSKDQDSAGHRAESRLQECRTDSLREHGHDWSGGVRLGELPAHV